MEGGALTAKHSVGGEVCPHVDNDAEIHEDADFSDLPVHFQPMANDGNGNIGTASPPVSELRTEPEQQSKPKLVDASTQYFDTNIVLTPNYRLPPPPPPQGKVDSGSQYSPTDVSHLFPTTGASGHCHTAGSNALHGVSPVGYYTPTGRGSELSSASGHCDVGVASDLCELPKPGGHLGCDQNGGSSSALVNKPYKCPECDASFTRVDHLSRHLKTQRSHFHTAMTEKNTGSPESPAQYHPCPHCGKLFTRRDHMKRHSKIHMRGEPVKCVECMMWFPAKGQLNWHMLQVHYIPVFECSYCSKSFSQAQYLTRHLREKHFMPDRGAAGGSKQDQNGKTISPPSQTFHLPYRCGICSLNFGQESECADHMMIHSEQNSGAVSSQPVLRQHADHSAIAAGSQTHSQMFSRPHNPSSRDVLQSSNNRAVPLFPRAQPQPESGVPYLNNAVMAASFPYPAMAFMCQPLKTEPGDGERFRSDGTNQGGRSQVMETGISNGSQAAGVYKGAFAHPDSLASIAAQQAKEKLPFLCGVCGLSFIRSQELKMHLRKHSGHRPFACEECGASFSSASNLIRHQRTHSGERPFKCNECTAAFTHKGALVNHERIHTGQRPYECELCGAAFARCDALSRHRKTHKENRIKQELESTLEGSFGLQS